MKVVKDTYFKQGKGLISGIPLSRTDTKETHFINCDFHPNTWDLKYRNCVFEDCGIKGCHTMAVDCIYIGEWQ